MSIQLRLVILIGIIVYFACVLVLLKKRHLALRYSLLWLFSGLLMLILDVFPQLLVAMTELSGIELPVNGLFAVLDFCFILILMSLTGVISRMGERNKQMTQEIGLLENRVRKLEEELHKEGE